MDRWCRSRTVAALGALLLVAGACGGADEPTDAASDRVTAAAADRVTGPAGGRATGPAGDSGLPTHVHGLGVDPADGALLVATHHGLYRVPPAGGPATPVGELRQDTMGFTVVGPHAFLASGHPDPTRMEPDGTPHLGLIASSDAGRTWESRSLSGEADFHALRAVGARVVGYDALHGRVLTSVDGGRSWRERPVPEPLVDLALRPGDPSRIVASGGTTMYGSDDGGASWTSLPGAPALLAWPEPDALVAVDAAGQVSRSHDGGRTWTRVGTAQGEPAALVAASRDELYLALHDGSIVRSRDGGASFAAFSAPSSGE